MAAWISRRRFVQGAAAGGLLAGLGDFGFMSKISPVSAAESKLRSGMVTVSARDRAAGPIVGRNTVRSVVGGNR